MSLLAKALEKYATHDESDRSGWSELLENKNGELSKEELATAIEMVAIVEMRERGIVPDHYTATTECKHCGPIPIFEGLAEKVNSCPWCLNRIKGLPIPREWRYERAKSR